MSWTEIDTPIYMKQEAAADMRASKQAAVQSENNLRQSINDHRKIIQLQT
jgi:hypothetical protein